MLCDTFWLQIFTYTSFHSYLYILSFQNIIIFADICKLFRTVVRTVIQYYRWHSENVWLDAYHSLLYLHTMVDVNIYFHNQPRKEHIIQCVSLIPLHMRKTRINMIWCIINNVYIYIYVYIYTSTPFIITEYKLTTNWTVGSFLSHYYIWICHILRYSYLYAVLISVTGTIHTVSIYSCPRSVWNLLPNPHLCQRICWLLIKCRVVQCTKYVTQIWVP